MIRSSNFSSLGLWCNNTQDTFTHKLLSWPFSHHELTYRGTQQVLRSRPQSWGHRTESFLELSFLRQCASPPSRSSRTLPLLPVTRLPTDEDTADSSNGLTFDMRLYSLFVRRCEKQFFSTQVRIPYFRKINVPQYN